MDTKTLLEWSATYHTPNYGSRAPICLVRGDGMRVWDTDGREYLDFGAGHRGHRRSGTAIRA